MKLPGFVYSLVGKFIGGKLDLKEGPLEDKKKWYQSKNVITSIVTALMGLYLSLQPQFGWPSIPEWVFVILGSLGVYTRIVATTKIG